MASRDTDRPNVIVILTDDQGHWAMGCAGNSEIRTPNLDRLAATGTRFENMFCASPVCSPARASLLTGRIPSQHGVHDWLRAGNTGMDLEKEAGGKLIRYLEGCTGYTDVLAANGYTCGISGKWHMGDSHHSQKGFTFWEVHAKGGGPYYNAPMVQGAGIRKEEKYVTDAITDTALRFLENQEDAESPFYLSVHYTAPHSPWGREHHPKDLWDEYYHDCAFRSVPSGLAPPTWAERLSIPVNDEETRRSHLSGYFAAVTAMDANVGRILDWLEHNGLRENTLVFFTSDNGMSMGHHGVYGKGNATFPMNMFDTAVKVPALLSRPGHVPRGMCCDDLLSHYDFMPTLLDYLGFETPDADRLPGQSVKGILEGTFRRDDGQHVVVADEYGPVRMIRSRHWKYIHRYPYGPHEFYDLRNDPLEQTNLIDSPDYPAKIAELRSLLENWFVRYADPAVDGVREPVTGLGQIGRAGIHGGGRRSYCAP